MFKRLIDQGKCALGQHAGEWAHEATDSCTLVRICERCGNRSKRIEHTWVEWQFVAAERCDQERVCARCAQSETRTLHDWGDAKLASADNCRLVRECRRCRDQRDAGSEHAWGEWCFVAADRCEQVQVCARCQARGEERFAHRWGRWAYDESYGEAVHTCLVCGAEGTRSEFELLDDSVYDAPVVAGARTAPGAPAAQTDVARLAEQAMAVAVTTGDDRSFWLDKLRAEVERERGAGNIGDLREERLHEILSQFEQHDLGAGGSAIDRADNRGKLNELMERMLELDDSDTQDLPEGSRAARISSLANGLRRHVKLDAIRGRGSLEGSDELLDELTRPILQAHGKIQQARGDDARVLAVEREQLRPAALRVRQYQLRDHLMLADPIWGAGTSAPNPNAVFFSGSRAVGNLTRKACRLIQMDVLPASGSGDPARFRFRQLQQSHITVLDMTGYDRDRELEGAEHLARVAYETGIALALGKPVVAIGSSERALPFDVDVAGVYIEGDDGDAEMLADALDQALYGPARGASGSTLADTVAYLTRWSHRTGAEVALEALTADAVYDAARTRRVVGGVLDQTAGAPQMIFPTWAGAYPDAERPLCFHVTPYRPWTEFATVVIRDACERAGMAYVRGDETLDSDIVQSIWRDVGRATHVVVDLSGLNFNAVLELGMAHTLGQHVLLIGQEIEEVEPVFNAVRKRKIHAYRQGVAELDGLLDRFLASGGAR